MEEKMVERGGENRRVREERGKENGRDRKRG